MQPWEKRGLAQAPDGTWLELRQRGHEFRIWAGGGELMSSEDEGSSKALAELGCEHLSKERPARVLVGGLGMGYTLRAALDCTREGKAQVEISEFVPAVVEWNREMLGDLAGRPLDDERCELVMGDVREHIAAARNRYDAILLDVDNGPAAHAHVSNEGLYSRRGLSNAWNALRPGGVLGVWSIWEEQRFTDRLKRQGYAVQMRKVEGSRKGRGRFHVIWLARRP